MQVVDNYAFAPGQCYTCSGNDLPAIDTQHDTNLGAADARVYLCGTCVGAMWSMMSGAAGSPGLVPARSYQEQVVRADGAEARANDLEEAIKALRGESPLAGAMQVLAETMGRSFTPAQQENDDVHPMPDRGGNTISEEPRPFEAEPPADETIDVGPPAADEPPATGKKGSKAK
jgi:hypothetical protein